MKIKEKLRKAKTITEKLRKTIKNQRKTKKNK